MPERQIRPTPWCRADLRKVPHEIHRVVEQSDDLHRFLRADSIEDDVPSGPASLADVMSEDPGQDIVARLAA